MARSVNQARREAKRLLQWCIVQGELDEERVRRAVKKIRDSHHRGYFALLLQFQRLIRFEVAKYTVTVEAPFLLSQDFRIRTEKSLRKTYGSRTVTTFAQHPELIGGMRIRIGCDVYDGSVMSKLAFLQKRFGIEASPKDVKVA